MRKRWSVDERAAAQQEARENLGGNEKDGIDWVERWAKREWERKEKSQMHWKKSLMEKEQARDEKAYAFNMRGRKGAT